MPQNLFVQDTIAVIWDFDKTLSRHYMQKPLFEHFGVNESDFWAEVNNLGPYYIKNGSKRVSKDTLYLNHILTYVRDGIFHDLNNALLKELGGRIQFYEGIPDFFGRAKQSVVRNPDLARHSIKVEHYVVSTGLREMIIGSQIGPLMDDVWACEFVEVVAQPGYLKKDQPSLFDGTKKPTIVDIGYVIDNTSKTRAIFEINKGTNKLADIDVNATIAPEDRRIPFQNMIYVADGPSDVPAFSIVNQSGGATFAVYEARNRKQFQQVATLQKQGRVQGIGEANYTDGSLTSMWLTHTIEEIGSRIVRDRERLLSERVGQSPKHIISVTRQVDTPADAKGGAQIEQSPAVADIPTLPAAPSTETQLRPPESSRPKESDVSGAKPAA